MMREFATSYRPEPWLLQPLLSITLILVCLLCMACLIVVLISIKLVMRSAKDSQKLEKGRESKWDGEKIIKSMTDPFHHLIETAHHHLSSFTQDPTGPTSNTQPGLKKLSLPSTEMTSQLQDVATVATPGAQQDIVFHITSSGYISYWSSKTQDESQGEQYNSDNLKVGGDRIIVNPKLPIIAAVAYSNGSGEDVVRLFYVSQSEFTLREVRRTGPPGSQWVPGRIFNDKSYSISEQSGLTANVVETYNNKTQLKVFYQPKTDKLSVAYSVLAIKGIWERGEEWSSRYNVTE